MGVRAIWIRTRRVNFRCRNLANMIWSRQRTSASGNLQHWCVMAENRYKVESLHRYNVLRQKKAGRVSAFREGSSVLAVEDEDDPFADVPLYRFNFLTL